MVSPPLVVVLVPLDANTPAVVYVTVVANAATPHNEARTAALINLDEFIISFLMVLVVC